MTSEATWLRSRAISGSCEAIARAVLPWFGTRPVLFPPEKHWSVCVQRRAPNLGVERSVLAGRFSEPGSGSQCEDAHFSLKMTCVIPERPVSVLYCLHLDSQEARCAGQATRLLG